MRQVLGLKALYHLCCMAWQLEVCLVLGAGEQVSLCAYSCSLLSCVLLADRYKSCLGFASGARRFSALPPPVPLGGVALGLVPSCAMSLLLFPIASIVQQPGSTSSNCHKSLLPIRLVPHSFPDSFAHVCFQHMKIDWANQLVKVAVAHVRALEFAVGALSLCSLVAVLISFVEQSPGGARLGTLVRRFWFGGRKVGGGRQRAGL